MIFKRKSPKLGLLSFSKNVTGLSHKKPLNRCVTIQRLESSNRVKESAQLN
jgi:hypothetical protein